MISYHPKIETTAIYAVIFVWNINPKYHMAVIDIAVIDQDQFWFRSHLSKQNNPYIPQPKTNQRPPTR